MAAPLISSASHQPLEAQPDSPLPPPPESSTSGPRALALQTAFSKALEATLKKCNYDNFSACFPTAAQYAPDTMQMFWKTFTEKLEELCKAQFTELLTQRNVIPSLNALDSLITDARSRKAAADATGEPNPLPPHTLSPHALLDAHLVPFLDAEATTLKAQLEGLQKENGELGLRLKAQRTEIENLVEGLEDLVRDLEGAAGLVQAGEWNGLVDEVRGVEREIGRV